MKSSGRKTASFPYPEKLEDGRQKTEGNPATWSWPEFRRQPGDPGPAKRMALAAAVGNVDIERLEADDFGGYLVYCGVADPDLMIRTSGRSA
jgi:hypothetical protein